MPDEFRPSRRIVFHGLTALGVAAVLAGCGGDDDPGSSGNSADKTDSSTPPSGTKSGNGGTQTQTVLARTSDVPVGGGLILTGEKIVITQPTEGEFKAFTAVCTHQGFTVTSVEDDRILCNHHGSVYDFESGENIGGPAPAPLDPISITVKGGDILQA
jgi:nitrite reductase/ring-hydroxylating ferredoxin subunit